MNGNKMRQEYLEALKALNNARADMIAFREILYSPPTQKINGMPVEHSGETDELAGKIETLVKLENLAKKNAEKLDKLTSRYIDIRERALTNEREKECFTLRVLRGIKWDDLPFEMSCSKNCVVHTWKNINYKLSKIKE